MRNNLRLHIKYHIKISRNSEWQVTGWCLGHFANFPPWKQNDLGKKLGVGNLGNLKSWGLDNWATYWTISMLRIEELANCCNRGIWRSEKRVIGEIVGSVNYMMESSNEEQRNRRTTLQDTCMRQRSAIVFGNDVLQSNLY